MSPRIPAVAILLPREAGPKIEIFIPVSIRDAYGINTYGREGKGAGRGRGGQERSGCDEKSLKKSQPDPLEL